MYDLSYISCVNIPLRQSHTIPFSNIFVLLNASYDGCKATCGCDHFNNYINDKISKDTKSSKSKHKVQGKRAKGWTNHTLYKTFENKSLDIEEKSENKTTKITQRKVKEKNKLSTWQQCDVSTDNEARSAGESC